MPGITIIVKILILEKLQDIKIKTSYIYIE